MMRRYTARLAFVKGLHGASPAFVLRHSISYDAIGGVVRSVHEMPLCIQRRLILTQASSVDGVRPHEEQQLATELKDLKIKLEHKKARVQKLQVEVQESKARVHEMQVEVQESKARVQEMQVEVQEMQVEVQEMKAQRLAIEAFLRNPDDCRVDTDAFQGCSTDAIREASARYRALEQRIDVKEQDIRVKEQDIRDQQQRIRVKEQDIKFKEQGIKFKEQDIKFKEQDIKFKEQDIRLKEQDGDTKEQDIREQQQRINVKEQFTYADSLRANAKAETLRPSSGSRVRIGRSCFDAHLRSILCKLASREPIAQMSRSVVLQCASGVGKTFACNTFRRGQLSIQPPVDYVPFSVYLGFNQGFELTNTEETAISERVAHAIQSVLYQRLAFTLNGILQEINRHRDAPDPFVAALDGTNGEWVQKLPLPDKAQSYRYRTIRSEQTDDATCILTLLNALRSAAERRLAILVCVDEGQYLDQLAQGSEEGGARVALRVLRSLQIEVIRKTGGEVLLLPITTGINAKVSLESATDGENIVFGANDEALMAFDDFRSLLHAKLVEIEVSVDSQFLNLLVAAHYPHVREMLESPTVAMCNFRLNFELSAAGAMEIVIAAFLQTTISLNSFPKRCPFPVGRIPLRLCSEESGVPVLSFHIWPQIHASLFKGTRITIPMVAVNDSWQTDSPHWASFESRCFYVLRYFFAIFGPVEKLDLCSEEGSVVGLRAPLQNWLPDLKFRLCAIKNGVLENSTVQHNPFTCPSRKGLKNMGSYELTSHFVQLIEKALLDTKPGMAQAVWVMCGGSAPIDYILLVFQVDGDEVKVHMRFADAKHTTKREADNTKQDNSPPKKQPARASSKNTHAKTKKDLYDVLSPKMIAKAKRLHEQLSPHLQKRQIVVMPFDGKNHFMLCHNGKGERMLSKSTFEWAPWSHLLFL